MWVYFRSFYQSMRTEIITFLRAALLFSELCCLIQCNWKYFNLFLIGCWTATSWRIYHQAFSVTITGWTGCKFGVFSNICVRAYNENATFFPLYEGWYFWWYFFINWQSIYQTLFLLLPSPNQFVNALFWSDKWFSSPRFMPYLRSP